MKRIPSGSVDMILCDLPYGTTQNKWDAVIPFEPLWSEYWRIVKPNAAIVLTAQPPFDKILGASQISALKYEWIWRKNVSTGHLNAKKQPLKAHENIMVFYKEQCVYIPQMGVGKPYAVKRSGKDDNGKNYGKINMRTDTINSGDRFPNSIIDCDRETGYHPTQKPVALFEYLVKTYTNPGDTVLDNCMGSGTTGVACKNLDRSFIGIERDPEYFRLASERIASA